MKCWLPHTSSVRIEINTCGHSHVHKNGGYYPNQSCKEHDIILQQFTGLLDKNGKEIYEGDVLSHRYEIGSPIAEFEKFAVEWSPDGFWTNCRICGEAEVIGNIYENLELLK